MWRIVVMSDWSGRAVFAGIGLSYLRSQWNTCFRFWRPAAPWRKEREWIKRHRTRNHGEEARKSCRKRIRSPRALWKPAEYLPNLRRKVRLRSEAIRSIAGEQALACSVTVFDEGRLTRTFKDAATERGALCESPSALCVSPWHSFL